MRPGSRVESRAATLDWLMSHRGTKRLRRRAVDRQSLKAEESWEERDWSRSKERVKA